MPFLRMRSATDTFVFYKASNFEDQQALVQNCEARPSYSRCLVDEQVKLFMMKTLAFLLLVALAMQVVVSTSTSASGQLSITSYSLGVGLCLSYTAVDAWFGRRRRRWFPKPEKRWLNWRVRVPYNASGKK